MYDGSMHCGPMMGSLRLGPMSGSLRSTYYSDDRSNHPPPSPTGKWKGTMHATSSLARDDPKNRVYLPDPFPLKKAHRTRSGHPGGFQSMQEPLQPPKFPNEDQVYSTYAEWWWAQQPKPMPGDDKEKTFSTSYWPYGRRMSCIASVDNADEFYHLDKRVVKNHVTYKDRRAASTGFLSSRSSSAAELFASQQEHFGYNRSMGRSQSSHHGATFHAERKAMGVPVGVGGVGVKSGKGSHWGEASAEDLAAGVATNKAWFTPAQSARSEPKADKYTPNQTLQGLGMGTRAHAEWRLPQTVKQVPWP